MGVLRLLSVAAGGLARGLAVAERAESSLVELRRTAKPRHDLARVRLDSDAMRGALASYPSQRDSAALLDPYLEHAALGLRRARA